MTDEEFKISTKFNIDSKPLIIDGVRYYSEAVLKLYAKGFLKSRVNTIRKENENLQKAFDSMYEHCLRLLKKHEPETLKKRINEIEKLLKQ